MFMKKISLGLALTLGMLAGSANALTFDFSFSNNPAWGNIAGTVTGEIVGLTDNATSAASAVYIDTYPTGLNQFGTYSAPFDVLAWTGSVGENSFTVANGVITGGHFDIYSANGINDQLYINSTCCGGAGTNFLDIGSNDSQYVWNDSGMGAGGVTFSAAAVPEPTSLALLGMGVVGVIVSRRRKTA